MQYGITTHTWCTVITHARLLVWRGLCLLTYVHMCTHMHQCVHMLSYMNSYRQSAHLYACVPMSELVFLCVNVYTNDSINVCAFVRSHGIIRRYLHVLHKCILQCLYTYINRHTQVYGCIHRYSHTFVILYRFILVILCAHVDARRTVCNQRCTYISLNTHMCQL